MDNAQLIKLFDSGENLKFLFFWGHQKSDSVTKSCFSQWYEISFEIEGVTYHNAEQFMMAQKALLFKDHDIYNQIISSTKPGKVKELGRQVRNFDQQVWEDRRYDIVVRGNYHKFSQNKELSTFLINTNDRILIEASPVDTIWGIGLAQDDERVLNPNLWKGQNLLGYALMEVRDQLKG
ncbi:NADAR family protein [Leeuwenhoekiella parthenopeia]|uniref:NADAR family protein n=1 Tax=Leeuwenhoekiella parthenopeia TaxID=2890320 RepID=A0ABS8GUN2_9FLAO|nr:NADAR family protein [Leeuwenhoekiella parthenopeia]MCC4213719.1 NADAR family protein [Leeuwenhoekiella parthenopeia]